MIRQFLQRLRTSSKSTPSTVVAVVLQGERIKMLWLQRVPLQVLKVETVAIADASAWPEHLARLSSDIGSNVPVCIVLPPSHYQLYVVDKPAVPDSELASALPWLVAEMSDTPAADLVIDYFEQPDVANQRRKLQLVVAQKTVLQTLCKALQRKHIQLANIQPDEWLIRNLVPSTGAPVLVLSQQPGQDVSVLILMQGVVYFSRKLRGYSRLDQYDVNDFASGVLENLMLEIQRSMDYFEGQLRQPPIRDIYLLLTDHVQQALAGYLQQNGFGQVQAVNLTDIMAGFTPQERDDYWLALAGAMEVLLEADHEATR